MTPIKVCIERVHLGLYQQVKEKQIKNFKGIDSHFDDPNILILSLIED
ncbi:adenylyl-sulfate kinase [Aquirufa ecclesiirivi]|nr:adenylyl-sulfate kinase [Aquirufa ecclesiirivi]